MDLMSVCRTCMSSTSLNRIFPLPEAHERFSKAIFLVTGIKVTLNDGLPQHMCIECLKQVNDAMKFRAKCKETEESLMKIKHEVRRAKRHNRYVTDSKDLIREIKVDNRWVKINNSALIATADEDDDEQPLVGLSNTQANNNIQNVYINEADGQIIPLEMLKVEIDSSAVDSNNYDDTMNSQELTSNVGYSIENAEYLVTNPENSITEEEDSNEQESNRNEEEGAMNVQEHTMNDEDTMKNEEDENNHQEYIIKNPEDIHNDEKNSTVQPEYTITITNLEGNFNNHMADIENSKDHDNSDLLKTYYIMKDTITDTAEANETEMEAEENPDFDNINISENQGIIVMDNKESLYVIDMSNPSSKRVTCKLCQKNLSIRSIDLHLSKCHPGADGRRVKCQLCDNFVTRDKMAQHRLVMHGAEAYQCRYCKSQFDKEEVLIDHVMSCTARKKRKTCDSSKVMVECELCHKRMQKASMRLHVARTHAGLRPVCVHCGKSFGNKLRLYEHKRAKHGYEKFKCSQCQFESASSVALKNHERRHSGEKPYVCERCGAKFHAAYLLAQHRHSHRTDRSYKCEVCGVCFKTNNGLHSHRRIRHGSRRLPPSQLTQ